MTQRAPQKSIRPLWATAISTEAGEETMVFGAVTVGAKDKLLLGDEADGLGEEARVSASGSDR